MLSVEYGEQRVTIFGMYQTMVRLPDGLADALREQARENNRSMNMEIAVMLEIHLGIRKRARKRFSDEQRTKYRGKYLLRGRRQSQRGEEGIKEGLGGSPTNPLTQPPNASQGGNGEHVGRIESSCWEQWPALLAQFVTEKGRKPRSDELMTYRAEVLARRR